MGRLGNQLFQIAATMGIATRNGASAVFPRWPYAPVLACALPQADGQIAFDKVYAEPSFPYRDVVVRGQTALYGYFQSERYFQDCAADIRRLFTPHKDVYVQLASRFPQRAHQQTCSIHVRRTDYLTNPGLVDLCAGDYYERAISQIDPPTIFYVFSDDMPWCRKRFIGSRFVFVEGLRDFADLILMSQCDSHIIANSSFSWWGAWLDPNAEKTVIAPTDWFAGETADPAVPFVAGPPHRGFHDTRDLLPERWIKL